MIRKLFGYFFTGLAVLLPVGLSAYVVYKVVQAVDSLIQVQYSGIGLLLVIISVTSVGMLASLFVGRTHF